MAVNPSFPGGDPNKPWDKQPWDTATQQHNDTGESTGEQVAGAILEGGTEVAAAGCSGCSCAVFMALFLVGGTAMAAVFR